MVFFSLYAEARRIFTQAEARIDSFADFSRNARIARLKLYASYPDESANLKSKLFKACQEHFADFLTKYVCFLDLSPYLPSLERKHQVELVEAAARHSRGLAPRPSDSEVSMATYPMSWSSLTFLKGQSYPMDHFRGQCTKATLLSVHREIPGKFK